ncbi:type II toxin-antitoxin system RelE/ParE family toxin [Rhizobium sp. LjRoot30]|uniref:type II toxin-antitoxin system RelE/ParE family toxin n=1 Tax=Rhizobium sp. LjRoot30 TaxID=3342320 RepID=UPI003ECED196
MRRLVFSPKSLADIDRIFDYTEEKWGSEQAETYIFELRDCCSHLVERRQRGRVIGGVRPGYLSLTCGSHFIIYRETSNSVRIIRILHRRMNIAAHL